MSAAWVVWACNDTPTSPYPESRLDVETSRQALLACQEATDCPAAPACRTAHCLSGQCRYLVDPPGCCTLDEECLPQDYCSLAHCELDVLSGEGQCESSPHPARPDCCLNTDECPAPQAGNVVSCAMDSAVGYPRCQENLDPSQCTPPFSSIVINEFHPYAGVVSDTLGEWIELYNTGLSPVNLQGWRLADEGSDSFVLESASPLIIGAGDYFVLGRSDNVSSNGGYVPDYVYYNMILSNGIDEIILINSAGEEVDRVEYGDVGFEAVEGASFELLSPYLDNNQATHWVHALGSASGYLDLGTPGTANTDAFFAYQTSVVCGDGNQCTLDLCGVAGIGECLHEPITDCCQYNVDCNDGDSCTADTCQAETLTCLHTPIPDCCHTAAQCNDNVHCTLDSCLNGRCRHALDPAKPLCCTNDAQCADVNPCTVDYCSLDVGGAYKTCHHISPGGVQCCMNDLDCNDNVASTIDKCVSHQCQHTQNPEYCTAQPPLFCNDNDPCTTDACNLTDKLCVHSLIPGCCRNNAECEDEDVCTTDICQLAVHTCTSVWKAWCCHEETDCEMFMTDMDMCKMPLCVANECRLLPSPTENCCLTTADCDDANPCTTDQCNPGTHLCSHSSLGKSCCLTDSDCDEDDDPCTQVHCSENECVFRNTDSCCKADFECEDGNPCSLDRCIDYQCRFLVSPEWGCCLSRQDCPPSPSDCLELSCSAQHACVLTTSSPCLVSVDWLERFSGHAALSGLGWESAPQFAENLTLGPGTGPIGSDPALLLTAPADTQLSSVCAWSPRILSQDPDEKLSVMFETHAPNSEPGVVLQVKGRPGGLSDTMLLASFEATSQSGERPVSLTVPRKLTSAPFQLGFCLEGNSTQGPARWEVDTIRVGRGSPPRFVQDIEDIYREPKDTVRRPVLATDEDEELLALFLAGPGHLSLVGDTWSAQGNIQSQLVFWPTAQGDLGDFLVTLEVSDGFFEDRLLINEKVYLPLCVGDASCNDANECSIDSCTPWIGCAHDFIPECCNDMTPCDDGDHCTQDICQDGTCDYQPIECNDQDPCTDDACDSSVGCVTSFNSATCDDNSACTDADQCVLGVCQGAVVDCDDGLACTNDGCDPSSGCFNVNACEDSILCTVDACTPEGCRYGKVPIGTPVLDGIEGSEWPTSSLVAQGTTPLSKLRYLLSESGMHMGIKTTPPSGSALVVTIDRDFLEGTGISNFASVNTGTTGLGAMLASSLDVVFPGFGADLVVVVRFPTGATGMPDLTSCYNVSSSAEPEAMPCSVAWTPMGIVEVTIPWTTLYGDTDFQGEISAAAAALVSSSGQVVKTLPAASGSLISDVRLFGVADPVCLSAFCGDGFQDAGEECDEGEDNSDVLADTCREDCRLPRCGDGVTDSEEQCDQGDDNSNVLPDRCRMDCTPYRCGDDVIDSGEQCDDGTLNSNTLPDHCRENCLPARCGDGTIDSQEQCDDGTLNANTADHCRTTCLTPFCGDGITDSEEQCDSGGLNSDSTPDACRTDCDNPVCGDGIIDTLHAEVCDNGSLNSNSIPDRCRLNCVPAHCGDGVQDANEECDDGNSDNWDGCQNDCTLYVPSCGDGVQTPGEECDQGVNNSNTLPDHCREDCRNPRCGDWVIDTGELCDDGNLMPGDTCDSDCTPYVAVCGNGWKDPGEECDSGVELNSDVLPDRCRTNCTLPRCGDGVKDGGEACDNGVYNSNEVANACRSNCVLPWCGDDVVDSGEQCDDGVANASLANHCKPNCMAPYCGDGFVDDLSGEACDQGVNNSNIAPNACRENCQPFWCGDGVTDANEACDDGALNSDTVADACRTDCDEPFCGDGVQDSGEQCDEGLNNANAIPDRCHLGCIAPRCGDGIVDVLHNEECDDGNLNNDLFPNFCRTTCVEAHCGDGVIDSGEECDDHNNVAGDGCDPLCFEEVYIPVPGDVIFTEIMQNPAVVSDAVGEYFEVYNTRDFVIDLNRWVISSSGDVPHTIDREGGLLIAPHTFIVFGLSNLTASNGGVTVNYVYTGVQLLNGADTLVLSFKGSISDEVAYDGGPLFPDPSGASMSLDPDAFSGTLNDTGSNWCEATAPLSGGDKGTPGAMNGQCP